MNRLAVSNIAWSPDEEVVAYELLVKCGVKNLEIAPPRFWPDIFLASEQDIHQSLQPALDAGLQIVAFQAILFGKADLLLFDANSRPLLAGYLNRMAQICAWSGAKTMVFGAPANRLVPEGMTKTEAFDIATNFFQKLGKHASDLGVTFGIEANPTAYQCNFCTHVGDVIELVRRVDSPGVRWHLDSGELAMNQENIVEVISNDADLICHAHVSEPMLGGFEQPWSGHAQVLHTLEAVHYTGPISLEMKRQPDGLAAVERAIRFANSLGVV